MKATILTAALIALSASLGMAQEAPLFLPGDGVYTIGIGVDGQAPVSEPTLVAQAYQASFTLSGVDLASLKAGSKTYNLAEYINPEATLLDLKRFMGIGEAYGLIVRNLEGESYQLGDFAPEKSWSSTQLLAAYPKWQGKRSFPLGVYNHWDCPVTFEADPMLGAGTDAIRVDFGNPHEGLVISDVNFPLVLAPDCDPNKSIEVTLNVWNDQRTSLLHSVSSEVSLGSLIPARVEDGNNVCLVAVGIENEEFVISTPFDVCVSGLGQEGVHVWIPRAVDTHEFFPTHTTYLGTQTQQAPASDVCINVQGYFNYLGTWGWWDGKSERGEVVPTADFVQVYYDPSDPDWPGDYFRGEAAFPVECTFGPDDIALMECPDWIENVTIDDSNWLEYGALQLIMSAKALPEGETGRSGKVVFTTYDLASQYTIYIRQGAAWFDDGTSEPDEDLTHVQLLDVTSQSGTPLDGAVLMFNGLGDMNDRETVTHIYLHYAEELESAVKSANFPQYVTITNTTTGEVLSLNKYSCGLKSIGGSDKSIVDIFLSSDNYINTAALQGVYTVEVQPGIAATANGKETVGCSFTFTYGNPEGDVPIIVDLNDYVGNYESNGDTEADASDSQADTFTLLCHDDTYYVTLLDGNEMLIPILESEGNYSLQRTTSGRVTFSSATGQNVKMQFLEQDGTRYIYLEKCIMDSGKDQITHGEMLYRQVSSGTSIENLSPTLSEDILPAFNLYGQPVRDAKGLRIVGRKKVML